MRVRCLMNGHGERSRRTGRNKVEGEVVGEFSAEGDDPEIVKDASVIWQWKRVKQWKEREGGEQDATSICRRIKWRIKCKSAMVAIHD